MGATGGHSLVSVNPALLPHVSDGIITPTASFPCLHQLVCVFATGGNLRLVCLSAGSNTTCECGSVCVCCLKGGQAVFRGTFAGVGLAAKQAAELCGIQGDGCFSNPEVKIAASRSPRSRGAPNGYTGTHA